MTQTEPTNSREIDTQTELPIEVTETYENFKSPHTTGKRRNNLTRSHILQHRSPETCNNQNRFSWRQAKR